jgi:UDP-glucose 4-epimerase
MKLEWDNVKEGTHYMLRHSPAELLDFRIGDVRDYESLLMSVAEADIVIHAAALKQIPTCEYFPYESVKTNILGVQNIIRAIRENENRVSTVLAVSTDKACKPINVYGMCKAIQERFALEANLRCPNTKFVCSRYGNVACSRGSVIPLFEKQIKNGGPVTITTREMTRFLQTLDVACDIIFDTIRSSAPGEIYVPILPSARIIDLAEVMSELITGKENVDIEFTGIRPGEKIHEILVSEEEIPRTIRKDNYYVIRPILPELGHTKTDKPVLAKEYSSAECTMSKSELKDFLVNNQLLDI